MHERAAERAGVEPLRYHVGEAGEHAALERFAGSFARCGVEPLVFGDAQKLLRQRRRLARGGRVNAERAAGLRIEIALLGEA